MENNTELSTLNKLLHEPMTHFVVLAALLFGIYGVANLGGGEVIEVRQQDIDARIFLREMSTGRELTREERDGTTALYIEEQILVREAVKRELDNDARIHDMLAQKMRHVLSGDVIQPDNAELRAYYEANRGLYTSRETVSVTELVFDSGDDPAQEALAMLAAGAAADAVLALEPGVYAPLPRVNRLDIASIFSDEFSDRVFAAQINEWVGPFVSNRGQHWLRVNEREAAELAGFEEIVDRVRFDWIATEEDRLLQIEVDRLWDDYVIVIND